MRMHSMAGQASSIDDAIPAMLGAMLAVCHPCQLKVEAMPILSAAT